MDLRYDNAQCTEDSVEIIYTEWESLKVYHPITTNCLFFLREVASIIIEPQYQWQQKFQAVTELRSLHKSIPSLFFSVFSITSDSIRALLSDSATSLTKNILLFLRELFSDFQDESSTESAQLIAWLRDFVPLILIKMTSSYDLIKTEASNCLYYITETMLYFDVLIIFLEESQSRNKHTAKIAFQAFEVLYVNMDRVYLREGTASAWAQLFELIVEVNDIKGVPYESMAVRSLVMISPIWSEVGGYATEEQREAFNKIHTEREISVKSKHARRVSSKHAIQIAKLNYSLNANQRWNEGCLVLMDNDENKQESNM